MNQVKKRFNPNILIALASCLAVVALVAKDVQRQSPGALTTVHGRIDELSASDGCAQCHGSSAVSADQSCLECHAPIAQHIETSTGLHGSLEDNVQRACALCHSEHHGSDFSMVNARSFSIAGIPNVEEFDHSIVGYKPEGAHAEASCAECHKHAADKVLPEGAHRYIGLSQSCDTCHVSPHPAAAPAGHNGRMARDCNECHNPHDFNAFPDFDHGQGLELVGGHAGLDCATCHEPGSAHSVEAVGGFARKFEARSCSACHDSPHASGFLKGVADLAREAAQDQSCSLCHQAEGQSFAGPQPAMDPAWHAASGFRLDAPHANVECAQCHGGAQTKTFPERFPGRKAEGCAECHTDPHQGQFDHAPFAEQGCIACHANTAFHPHQFDETAHSKTRFALQGAHLHTECNACHTDPQANHARQFAGLASACVDCHQDPHTGQFAEKGSTDCAACHSEVSFRQAAEHFDHTRWTGFALSGQHAAVGCAECHTPKLRPDKHGRTWERAAGSSCSDCHSDPHGGQFEAQGRIDCASCHTTEHSFKKLSFDHNTDSRFALDDTHRDLSCSQCHRADAEADFTGVRYKPLGMRCVDCHGKTRDKLNGKGGRKL